MPDADEAVVDEEVGVGCAVALGTGLRIVAVTIEAVAGAGVSLSGALDVARIHSLRYWSRQQRQNFESRVATLFNSFKMAATTTRLASLRMLRPVTLL